MASSHVCLSITNERVTSSFGFKFVPLNYIVYYIVKTAFFSSVLDDIMTYLRCFIVICAFYIVVLGLSVKNEISLGAKTRTGGPQ